MRFHFSLESVLRLRRSQQRQQELRVHHATEQVTRTIERLRAMDAKTVLLSSDYRAYDVRGAELEFVQEQRNVLEDLRRRTQFELAAARVRHSELLAGLRKIWQEREVLESLRKREFEIFLREQVRREQSVQDDLFLLRLRDRKPLPN